MVKRGICIMLGLILLGSLAGTCAEGMKDFEFADVIPAAYRKAMDDGGTILKVEYPSRDYFGEGAEVVKKALIYLPPDYSEEKRYDLLVLCHGVGGNEYEWGFGAEDSVGKNMMDHLITEGVIPPVIIVMPNGRSTANFSDLSMGNMYSFYPFGQELRNDLLPYMDANFATYGSDTPDDLSASRNHRAMAGLSMGGMQTINIGLGECLDLFSVFGAFSAAPTTNTATKIAASLDAFPDLDIQYFYSICGTEDNVAYSSASLAAKRLPEYTDRVTEDNWHWQQRSGGHDFNIWYLGLYNFVRIMGMLHMD